MLLRAEQDERLRFNTLDEWLDWQEELHFTSIELGLDRCNQVAAKMGLLKPVYKVISVAGTNGKGSSVTMLQSILRNAGYNTGSYISPHLIRYNERICINGKEVSDEILCASFNRIDRARGDISLTYFEFGTLAAFDIFQRAGIDIAILEVGLGGRLDAVNCLDADAALITSIDIDHENWLGHDREAIGREKAGIMRSTSPAIYSDIDPPDSVISCASELGTDLYILNRDFFFEESSDTWSWRSRENRINELPFPSLYNRTQIMNASGVLMALETMADVCPVSIEAIRNGLRDFNLAGRFQVVPDKAQLVLDVAHNREAAALLVSNLERLPVQGETHVLIGMLRDKNHSAVFRELEAVTDKWHLVTLEGPRGTDSAYLREQLLIDIPEDRITCYNTVPEALDRVRELVKPQDRIVVTGSFLTVGAAVQYLKLQH